MIESGGDGRAGAATIKSHHNVGGLPEDLGLELVEPLRMLFKDEVRAVATELGLPERIVWRQPFPGPGLGIRVVGGEVTAERLEILREADAILQEEIRAAGLYRELWQSFCVLPVVRSVGVQGDGRTYAYPIVIRAVTSDGRDDRGLGAAALRPAGAGLEPDHQRGPGRQPRRARHLARSRRRRSSGSRHAGVLAVRHAAGAREQSPGACAHGLPPGQRSPEPRRHPAAKPRHVVGRYSAQLQPSQRLRIGRGSTGRPRSQPCGQTSKWSWHPTVRALPVLPMRPIRWPVRTRSPSWTEAGCRKWAYR